MNASPAVRDNGGMRKGDVVWLALAAVLLGWAGQACVPAHEADPDLPKATLVTLQGKLRFSAALERLGQTGNRVVDLRRRLGQEASDPELDLALREVPFWQAVDAVAAQAGLRLTPYWDRGTSEPVLGLQAWLGDRPQEPLPVAYDGPFRVAVQRLTAVRDLAEPAGSKLVCLVEVMAEPRLQPILLRDGGPGGEAGSGPTPARLGMVKWSGEAALELPLVLPLPPRTARVVPELHLRCRVLTPPRQTVLRLEHLRAGAEAVADGLRLRLREWNVSRGGDRWQAEVELHYPAGRLPLESHQTWAFQTSPVELRSRAGGGSLRPQEVEVGIEEERAVRLRYAFRGLRGQQPGDWELVCRFPAPPVWYPLHAVFRDLPLP